MDRDYVILFDENGQPYIAHSFRSFAQKAGNRVKSTAKSAGEGMGRGWRANTKYLLKVGKGAKALYAYTQQQVDRLLGRGRKVLGNAANKAGARLKSGVEKAKSTATNVGNSIRGSKAMQYSSKAARALEKHGSETLGMIKNYANKATEPIKSVGDKLGFDERQRYKDAQKEAHTGTSTYKKGDAGFEDAWNNKDYVFRSYNGGNPDSITVNKSDTQRRYDAVEEGKTREEYNKTALGKAETFVRSAANKVKDLGSKADDAVRSVADRVKDNASDTLDKAKDKASKADDAVRAAADRVKDNASDTLDKAKDKASKAGDAVRSVADRVKDNASDTLDKAKDKASKADDAVRSVADRVKDAASDVIDSAKDVGTNLTGRAKAGIDAIRSQVQNIDPRIKINGNKIEFPGGKEIIIPEVFIREQYIPEELIEEVLIEEKHITEKTSKKKK